MNDPKGPEVVESRLCGWWAHELGLQCLRVWVSVSDEERARRIQNREGGDYQTCLELSKQRQSDDMERYSELYGIDLDDMSPYSLVVDADELDANEVFRVVSTALE
jgi:cytidylate kinase